MSGQCATSIRPNKISIFFDGTTNDVFQKDYPTNVRILYNFLDDGGSNDISLYFHGPGVVEGASYKVNNQDALTGNSCEYIIKEAYLAIARNYTEGDEIYIFGFSRGAFNARALGGFIRYVGVLNYNYWIKHEPQARISEAMDKFLLQYKNKQKTKPDPNLFFFPKVKFIGIFDTVLGLMSTQLSTYDISFDPNFYERSCHIMAKNVTHQYIHTPFLTDDFPNTGNHIELFAPGDHCCVGGSWVQYPDTSPCLSNGTLYVMKQQATIAGLTFVDETSHPQAGLFYFKYDPNGHIYSVLNTTDMSSSVAECTAYILDENAEIAKGMAGLSTYTSDYNTRYKTYASRSNQYLTLVESAPKQAATNLVAIAAPVASTAGTNKRKFSFT